MSLEPNPFGKVTEFQNYYDMDNPEWVRKWTAEEAEPGIDPLCYKLLGSGTKRSAGEGMLYGLGTHSIDQTLQLFGQPASVTAFSRVLRDPSIPNGADDSFTVILQYDPNGEQKDLIATVKTTIVSPMPMDRQMKFHLRGTGGSFVKVSFDRSVLDPLAAGAAFVP